MLTQFGLRTTRFGDLVCRTQVSSYSIRSRCSPLIRYRYKTSSGEAVRGALFSTREFRHMELLKGWPTRIVDQPLPLQML